MFPLTSEQAVSTKLNETCLLCRSESAFSEDGECMAVFLDDKVETIDARRGITTDLISIPSNRSIQPMAIAIGQNGKVLAVSSEEEGTVAKEEI